MPPGEEGGNHMAYYIGVDLGTSACKLLLVDEGGAVLNEVTKEYPLYFPRPGWSEQDPEDWRRAVREGVPELLAGFDAAGWRGSAAAVRCTDWWRWMIRTG